MMIVKYFFFFFILSTSHVYAQATQTDYDVCSRNHSIVRDLLINPENRLSFRNGGGLFNGGVCWWHSRFERASAYLIEFRPDLPKVSTNELNKKLLNLTMMKRTIIPGFKSLEEMSSENKDLIQKILNLWQVRDGFINQAWIKGVQGKTHLDSDKLKNHMENIFYTFQKDKKPYFLMLQLPSVVAHAFLLMDMVKTENGYQLFVIDSNAPGKIITQDYIEGTTSLFYKKSPYVPYLGFAQDFTKIQSELSNFCHEI
jgi:hypothetical protein